MLSNPIAPPRRDGMVLVPMFLLALVVLYLFAIETGANLQGIVSSEFVHEFVHDARHAAGIPCH